jgi:hypothetical protein
MNRIIYIGGSGRSGSTLIQSILGSNPGFLCIGEVQHIWKYLSWANVKCSCNNLIQECTFWSQVLKRSGITGEEDYLRLAQLSNTYNRTRRIISLERKVDNTRYRELLDATQELYSAIGEVAGENVLVDSSKTPSHLYLLTNIRTLDIRLFHLVRDPRGVAYSWKHRRKQKIALTGIDAKMDQRPMVATTLRWMYENYYTDKWRTSANGYTLLRFEDFIHFPYETLKKSLDELELQEIPIQILNDEVIELTEEHSIGGNPDRFIRTKIKISSKEEWRDVIHPFARLVLGLLSSPMLFRYGYKV